MSRYNFDKLGPDRFEDLAKALIAAEFGVNADVVIFGDGPDGAREATVTKYRPEDGKHLTWVFQAKFIDVQPQRTRQAFESLRVQLKADLERLTTLHRVKADVYVVVTNLSLTGVRNKGTRDRLASFLEPWRREIPDIRVWDAPTLSAYLDNRSEIRTTYLDAILPGDILRAMLDGTQRAERRRLSTLRAYLGNIVNGARFARTEESGDETEEAIPLSELFVDLTLQHTQKHPRPREESPSNPSLVADLATEKHHYWSRVAEHYTSESWRAHSGAFVTVPASAALFLQDQDEHTLLIAGPGYGKSTLCQLVALVHASRILGPDEPAPILERLREPSESPRGAHAASFKTRFPFRIELRRYAAWCNRQSEPSIAEYIANELINRPTDASFTKDDIFDIAAENPVVLILDGLDEVPNLEVRKAILSSLDTFVDRVRRGQLADLQLILSTRPQGYFREFDRYSPTIWEIQDLTRPQIDGYSDAWLRRRVPDTEERTDAQKRFARGLENHEVRRLAATLLQVTVILTIARQKHDIPHQRSGLFKRYVNTVFEREKNKSEIVKKFEEELRRLHEYAAFETHRQMQSTGASSLDANQFRSCVLRVWEAYRGTDPLPNGISNVFDDIFSAACDRLVFLKGEGEEQERIGFLLSSFREYFSAMYLVNSEDADRDKIFMSLLRRDGHWENVLLFYYGFQDAATQRGLLFAETVTNQDGAPEVALLSRFRRIILTLLPEFSALKKETIERALTEVLDPSTLWALDNSKAFEILRSLRNGTLQTAISSALRRSADTPSALTALRLGAHVLTDSSLRSDLFNVTVPSLIERIEDRHEAIALALGTGYPVSELDLSPYDYARGLDRLEHSSFITETVDVVQGMPARWTLGAYLASLPHISTPLREHSTFERLFSLPDGSGQSHLRFLGADYTLVDLIEPALSVQSEAAVRKLLSELQLEGSDEGKILIGLSAVSADFQNASAHDFVRSAAEGRAEYSLAVNRVLGPPRTMFSSENEYTAFLAAVARSRALLARDGVREQLVTEIADDTASGGLAFALRPAQHDLLESNGLASKKQLSLVRLTGLADVLATQPQSFSVVDISSFLPLPEHSGDVGASLLDVFWKILERDAVRDLLDFDGLPFSRFRFEGVPRSLIDEFSKKPLGSLPLGWRLLLARAAAAIQHDRPDSLLRLLLTTNVLSAPPPLVFDELEALDFWKSALALTLLNTPMGVWAAAWMIRGIESRHKDAHAQAVIANLAQKALRDDCHSDVFSIICESVSRHTAAATAPGAGDLFASKRFLDYARQKNPDIVARVIRMESEAESQPIASLAGLHQAVVFDFGYWPQHIRHASLEALLRGANARAGELRTQDWSS